jgi:D-glycero-alpha-D-manno-heptose-7-phosphate kinase
MIIRSRAPLRIGLAGGGTDVSPYCDKYGGAVLNVTIDKYALTTIKPNDDSVIRFIATDLNLKDEVSIKDVQNFDPKLKLHYSVYLRMMKDFNQGEFIPIEVFTHSEAPAGSGLGSSSTLVVSMIKAYVELLNLPFDDYKIANLAYQIERIDCGFGGGRQDHYSAAFGGFNFMEFFEKNRVVVNPLRVKNWIKCELESSLILFFSGTSRDSEKIIADQKKNIEIGLADALAGMHGMKQEAYEMKEYLLKGDFDSISACMKTGWNNKKKSAITVTNKNIDNIYEKVMVAGANAGKVSGAGGGGFMLFLVKPENIKNISKTLLDFDGAISTCNFTEEGCQSWKIF